MHISELLQLKFPEVNFYQDIILQDDGQGVYIKEWNLETPIPTEDELNNWASELDLAYRQRQAVLARVYPSLQAQQDMKYWDEINGTTVWLDTITAIKEAHPKPTE